MTLWSWSSWPEVGVGATVLPGKMGVLEPLGTTLLETGVALPPAEEPEAAAAAAAAAALAAPLTLAALAGDVLLQISVAQVCIHV